MQKPQRWIEGGGYVDSPDKVEKFIRKLDLVCEQFGFSLVSDGSLIIVPRHEENKMRLLDAMMSAEVAEVLDAQNA